MLADRLPQAATRFERPYFSRVQWILESQDFSVILIWVGGRELHLHKIRIDNYKSTSGTQEGHVSMVTSAAGRKYQK